MGVDPAGRGQIRRIELAGADQHRRQLAVDQVAVDRERREVVVGADRLATDRRGQGDLAGRVPEADVGQRGRVGLDLGVGDRRGPGEVVVSHLVDVVGGAGGSDVARYVRRLQRCLRGADLQRLEDRRVEHADDEGDEDPEPHRDRRQRPAARAYVGEQDHGRGQRKVEEDRHRRHSSVHVGVARALNVPVTRIHELPLGDHVPGRLHQGNPGTDDRQVRLDARRDPGARPGGTDAAVQVVEAGRHDQHHEQRHQEPGHDERDEGQRHDVEAEVLVEEGVLDVEGDAVGEEQVVVPLARRVEAGDEGHDEGNRGVDPPGARPDHRLEPPNHFVLGVKGQVARAERIGEQEVSPHEEEEDGAEDHRQADLDEEQRREHVAQADGREPHLIGPQHRQAVQRQEPDEDDEDHQTNPEASRKSP